MGAHTRELPFHLPGWDLPDPFSNEQLCFCSRPVPLTEETGGLKTNPFPLHTLHSLTLFISDPMYAQSKLYEFMNRELFAYCRRAQLHTGHVINLVPSGMDDVETFAMFVL